MVYQQDAAGWKKLYENEGSISGIQTAEDGSAWFHTWEALYSWDGHDWKRRYLFDDIIGPREQVTSLHALDSDHIWMMVKTSQQREREDKDEWYEVSKIYFYDGASWSMQYEIEGNAGLFTLDADHAWCWSGKDVYFYNGESWSRQFSSEYSIEFIEANSPECAWAIGYADTFENWSMAYFFDGSQWIEKGEIDQDIDSLEIVDDHLAWAWLASPGGRYYEGKPFYSDIFRWNGDTWQRSLDEDQDLVSVIILGPDLAWAAFHEKAYIYQDNHWSLKLEDEVIMHLAAVDDQNAWCIVEDVTSMGRILVFDGISWKGSSEIGGNCTNILANDPSHVWVISHPRDEVAELGDLIRRLNTYVYFFNGANWTRQFETDIRITGLNRRNSEQIWAYSNSNIFTADKE